LERIEQAPGMLRIPLVRPGEREVTRVGVVSKECHAVGLDELAQQKPRGHDLGVHL